VCDDGYQCNFDSCVKKPKEEPKAPEPAPADASTTTDKQPTCPAGQQLSTCPDSDPNCQRKCVAKDGCQCQASSEPPFWGLLLFLMALLTLFRRRRA
jgi:MYXO-CTERM domain-containing protein